MLRAPAFAAGTFNITPETDLLLLLLAAELGTSESGLVSGFATNTGFQQTPEHQSDVLTAQAAVVQNLQQTYGVTLSIADFLTTSFALGQPGVDSDLTALAAQGAIDASGEPDPAAVTLMATAGAAYPIAISPVLGSGGGGGAGTGGGGSSGGMMWRDRTRPHGAGAFRAQHDVQLSVAPSFDAGIRAPKASARSRACDRRAPGADAVSVPPDNLMNET